MSQTTDKPTKLAHIAIGISVIALLVSAWCAFSCGGHRKHPDFHRFGPEQQQRGPQHDREAGLRGPQNGQHHEFGNRDPNGDPQKARIRGDRDHKPAVKKPAPAKGE